MLLDKIREDEISLADTKNDQTRFKSNLNDIEKETKKKIKRAKKYNTQY